MKKNSHLLLLIAVVLLAIWPFSFFQFIPKWDNLDCYLPYKYFISDNIWNGQGPWWNPYMKLGYPAYSDMQNGMWNPIVWFLMLFGKYTTVSLVAEIVIYFIICAIGIYKFSELFIEKAEVRYIVSVVYTLSGFMVDNNQIMVFIMGYVWLPWILYYITKFNRNQNYRDALFAALFIALNITSASPAYTIILIYILVIIVAYNFFKHAKAGELSKKFVCGYLLMVVVCILLTLPFIISFIDFFPYFSRTAKLAYNGLLIDGSFDFAEYISFFFPYSVNGESDIFGTTVTSLRNAYFSIFLVIILVFSLLSLKNKRIWLFTGLGIFFLTIAAGDYLPIFKALYHLPGFGYFKIPGFFRGYVILWFIIAAGIGLETMLSKKKLETKNYKVLLFITLFLFAVSTIFALTQSSLVGLKENLTDLIKLNELPRGGIYPCIFINGVITIILLSIHLYSLLKKKKNQAKLLMVLVSLDVFIMFQLSIPTTFINKFRLKDHIEGFKKLPNEINQEPTTIPLKKIKEGDIHIDALWRNKSTFSKTPHYEGVNPTRSKSFLEIIDNNGLNFIIENPIFFIPYNEINSPENQIPEPNTGWNLPNGIHAQKETKIINAEIGYNSFTVEVENPIPNKSFVALSQNYHHFWKAKINGKQVDIYKINDGIMGVEIPSNYSGKIDFYFSPLPILKISFFISLIIYLLIFFYLIKPRRKS